MRSDLIWVLACWREVFVWEITTTVSLDKSSYSQISQCWEVITLAGIWQVARSHFNSSKTSNPVKSGIITPLKNCGQLLKKQPIVVFQLSWLPRSPYNEFGPRSSSANTEKLSSSSNGFLKHKIKLAISEGVKPLWTRSRETAASSTRIFSPSGVWMSLKLPYPTAMWSNYRNSWHSERNSLALIKSSGRSPVFCSSLSQSASSCALCLSRISAIVLLLVSSLKILSCLAIGINLYGRFLLGIASHARTKRIFWWGNFWV